MTRKTVTIITLLATVSLLGLKTIAIGYPSARLWGVNQLAYFPLPFIMAYLGLMVLFIVIFSIDPKTSKKSFLYDKAKNIFARIPPFAITAIVGIAFLSLFSWFSDSTNLLGDGMLRLGEMEKLTFMQVLETYISEPLDYLIHLLSYQYIFRPVNFEPITCFRFWAYLSGLVYALAALKFARQMKQEGLPVGLTFAYLMGWGGIMMFFGYVENYGMAAAVSIVYFYLAAKYFNSGKGIFSLVAAFLVAFFMHNLMIILLPSLIFIMLRVGKQNEKAKIALAIAAVVATAWVAFAFSHKEGGAFLLLTSKSESSYWLFGWNHLLDMLNELLLVSPTFVILVWIQKPWRNADTRQGQFIAFFRISAITGFVAFLLIDPVLGMAGDWDLFALLLLTFHVALFVGADWTKIVKPLRNAAIIITLLFAFLWVLSNSSEARSIARYKNIVSLDKERSRYGLDRLGVYMLLQERWQEAIDAYKISLNISPHYRAFLGIADCYEQLGQDSLAMTNYRYALELKPTTPLALYRLSKYEYQRGNFFQAREYLRRLSQSPEQGYDKNVVDMLKQLDSILGDSSGVQ